MLAGNPDHEIVFFVNGSRHVVSKPDPRVLLLDYLRSDAVGLTGTKKACGQGGCGACTVTLHRYNQDTDTVDSTAVNSCLRPLCSLDGAAITTVEGLGSVAAGITPVQNALIINNGSQCGYCTPGWVMSMHSYLAGRGKQDLDQREIEELFDGNLCRCTGYRPILHAMHQFASDFDHQDQDGSMRCFVDPKLAPAVVLPPSSVFPAELKRPPRALRLDADGYSWYRPVTLESLLTIVQEVADPADLRLVNGNTSVGIYGEPAQGITLGVPHIRVDISHIPDLRGITVDGDTVILGGATTYTEAVDWLAEKMRTAPAHQQHALDALYYMAHRTAGRIVRDVATLAGNTMLVARHVLDGSPFPSDMFTALCTLGAEIDVMCPGWTSPRRIGLLAFAQRYQEDRELLGRTVILRYRVPLTKPREWARTFKVALREINAHSIVNAGFAVALDADNRVTKAIAVIGGIGPIAFHLDDLESWLVGRAWDAETATGGVARVQAAVSGRINETRERMATVPDEGFTDSYRVHLAESFFYQFFVWLAGEAGTTEIPPELSGAGRRPARPASRGSQVFQTYPDEYPVSLPMVKTEGFAQATGEARYTHDLPLSAGGFDAALVVSTCPVAPSFSFAVPDDHGVLHATTAEELASYLRARFPRFVDLVTADDIPGTNEQQTLGPPDPLLCAASGGVSACGQALALVVASGEQEAITVAWFVQTNCIIYALGRPDGSASVPTLSFEAAIASGEYLDRKSMVRPGSNFDWLDDDEAVIDGVHCRIVRGEQGSMSPQIHYYMETHATIATPGENGPGSMRVQSSTQNPGVVMSSVINALGLSANQVEVQIERIGGGYGGKDTRTPWSAAITAVAANKIRRPVRLRVTRETDSELFGHSNPLFGSYTIAIGTGRDDKSNRGRLMGLVTDFWLNAGNTADVSPIILDTVILRSDDSYNIPNYRTTGTVCLTNTISNTSFRGLEALSSMLIHEDAIEVAANTIGMPAKQVRQKNLYQLGDTTPYGQVFEYCYLGDLWEYADKTWPAERGELTFDQRLAEIEKFNSSHRWRKRGISMVPVTYGMGWRLAAKERGDALIEIYSNDGTVLVRHGGVEMGQGINTQVTQIVAEGLNLPVDLIRIGPLSTAVIPDPTSTGASTGTAFNGSAAQVACRRLRARLESFCLAMLREHGPSYCAEQGLDFWSYPDGWQHEVSGAGSAGPSSSQPMWCGIVKQADLARVNLSTQAQHNETGDTALDTGFTFEHPETLQHFVGYSFSVAASEVEVDILTGEVTILRTDIFYDMGKSLNPATDVGQIEGAFVHGLGRVLTENVVYQPSGQGIGINNTPNTWGYKIPATTTIPLELNVNLYPRDRSAEVPENPNLLMSSKESGEPPMSLASTVYLAIKQAVTAARRDRGIYGWFRMDLPCTVQTLREACLVQSSDLTITSGSSSGGEKSPT